MKKLIILGFLIFAASHISKAAHFETGSAVPTQDLIEELRSLYDAKIAGKKVYSIKIEGHTDARGSREYNQRLSEARAVSTLQKLKEMGLKADKIQVVGLGESQLVSKGKTADDHAKNRRVVVLIDSSEGKSKTVIVEKPRVIVREKTVYKKNAIKLHVGNGPAEIRSVSPTVNELERDNFIGIGYQRMLNEDFSIEINGNTNESYSIGGGFHF